jgi:hypothetical protein
MFQNSKNASQPSEILRLFLNGGTGKVTADVKQKQQAIIEFLLLKGVKVMTLCSTSKIHMVEMHTVELRCSDG